MKEFSTSICLLLRRFMSVSAWRRTGIATYVINLGNYRYSWKLLASIWSVMILGLLTSTVSAQQTQPVLEW